MFSNSVMSFALLVIVKSANILVVVPTPSISHQIAFRPLTRELIKRNHEVTVLTADPEFAQGKTPKNLREIDLHDMSYMLWHKVYIAIAKNCLSDSLSTLLMTLNMQNEIFHEQLKDKSVLKFIKDKTVKFDLLILEEGVTTALIFSHIFEAPVIQMSSFGDIGGTMNVIGALTHPLVYPTQFHQRIYNLTYWEKITELHYHAAFNRLALNLEIQDDRMLQNTFGFNTPTLNELKNNVHMLILSVHPIWLHNQPIPPNVIYTWGIHKTRGKPLPKDLQIYLDSSKTGVIYISFGTNFKTSLMHPKTLEILLQVFSRVPYDILWKWDMDELPGQSENIKIYKWVPQYDVLRHPNLKLFITQGGLQSTDEAISAGVPLIGMPMFSDQEYNTEKYVHFKIGLKLRLKSLTIEKLENAIRTIFTDYDSYKRNIIQLRTQMHDQPKPPLENAIWWIEYVLRHGGVKHLRAPAAKMSWTEYYELELIFLILSVLMIVVTMMSIISYCCFKYALHNFKKSHLKQN